jgi:putative zinc finger/helix-turn-helix YgiT family protein
MTKKTTRPRSTRRRGGAVPADACPTCDTPMVEKRATLRLPVNGEEIAVPAAAHLSCPKCGEILLRYQDSRRLGQDAIALYRTKHNLLSADHIRAIRERFDLTQADLARLLRLGANTVSRWESGRNVQSAAMDMLLSLIRDVPGSIPYLRARAA